MILISLYLPTCFQWGMLAVYFAGQSSFLAGSFRVIYLHRLQQISYCNSRWIRAGFCWPMLSQSRFSNRTKCSFRRPVAPTSFFHSLVLCSFSLFGCIFGAHFCRLSLSVPGSHWVWSWTGSWICWAITWVLQEPPTTDRNSSVFMVVFSWTPKSLVGPNFLFYPDRTLWQHVKRPN